VENQRAKDAGIAPVHDMRALTRAGNSATV